MKDLVPIPFEVLHSQLGEMKHGSKSQTRLQSLLAVSTRTTYTIELMWSFDGGVIIEIKHLFGGRAEFDLEMIPMVVDHLKETHRPLLEEFERQIRRICNQAAVAASLELDL